MNIKNFLERTINIEVFNKFIMKFQIKKKVIGKGNSTKIKSKNIRNLKINIEGSNNNILAEKESLLINLTIYIRGNNNKIVIKDNVKFFGNSSIWVEDNDGEVFVDSNSSFEEVHLAKTEPGTKIKIGKDCMFAYDIELRTGDSHSIIKKDTKERINFAKNITIGDHVWVAAHCIILKGVVINNNSIIATGSVVTKSFNEENIIIAGNPAKKIKENINWLRDRVYN